MVPKRARYLRFDMPYKYGAVNDVTDENLKYRPL